MRFHKGRNDLTISSESTQSEVGKEVTYFTHLGMQKAFHSCYTFIHSRILPVWLMSVYTMNQGVGHILSFNVFVLNFTTFYIADLYRRHQNYEERCGVM